MNVRRFKVSHVYGNLTSSSSAVCKKIGRPFRGIDGKVQLSFLYDKILG